MSDTAQQTKPEPGPLDTLFTEIRCRFPEIDVTNVSPARSELDNGAHEFIEVMCCDNGACRRVRWRAGEAAFSWDPPEGGYPDVAGVLGPLDDVHQVAATIHEALCNASGQGCSPPTGP